MKRVILTEITTEELRQLIQEELRQLIQEELEKQYEKLKELQAQQSSSLKPQLEIEDETYLATHEAASMLGYSYNTLKCCNKEWGLETHKIGNRNFYKESDLKQFLKARLLSK